MVTIDYRVTGFQGWSKLDVDIKHEVMRQLMPFSKRLEAEVKASIKRNRPPAQSKVWATTKNSKITLFNTGFFREKVSARVRSGRGNLIALAEAGHFYPVNHPDGSHLLLTRLADVQLTGRRFAPTAEMRRAFWAKVGGRYKGKIRRKDVWSIPARDYLTPVMRNTRILRLFNAAIKRAEKIVYGSKKKR